MSHGFEENERHALVERWQHEQIARIEESRNILPKSEKSHAVGDAQPARDVFQPRAIWPVPRDEKDRTRNAGQSWEPLSKGLPQENAYETVLRDAMATDSLKPAGVYVGTRSGKLYASSNDGDDWMEIADALPSIACVKAAVLA